MIKRIIALMIAGIVLASPLVTEADDDLEYIRTTEKEVMIGETFW